METTNIPSNYAEMMAQLGIDNPKMLAMAQMMDQQQASQETEHEPSQDEALSSLKKENARLRKTLRMLEQLSLDFASAVGACPDCWGEDQACRTCQGHGKPGSGQIDEEAYAFFVAPLFDHLANHN